MTKLFTRTFRPVVWSLGLAAFFLGFTWELQNRIPGGFDNVVGALAIGISLILFSAASTGSHFCRRVGLLMSVALWSCCAAVAFMSLQGWTSGLIAFTWAFLAGGSYWVEAANKGPA